MQRSASTPHLGGAALKAKKQSVAGLDQARMTDSVHPFYRSPAITPPPRTPSVTSLSLDDDEPAEESINNDNE